MLQKLYENRRKVLFCVCILYLIGVFFITFIVREDMSLRTSENRGVVLTPFREFDAMLHQPNHFFWFWQIVLNILLFVPFGFLLPWIHRIFRNPVVTVMAGCMLSGVIETMQYLTRRGLTEVDDVITNTMGAAAGVILYYIIMAFVRMYQRGRCDSQS